MGSSVREALPAAASTRLADVLDAAPRPATVLAALPGAVYLAAEDGVVAVLAADAVRLPFGLVLPTSSRERPLDRCGRQAYVGNSTVVLDGLRVRWARWWQPPRPRPPQALESPFAVASVAAGLRVHLPGPVRAASADLVHALHAGDREAAEAAADRLVGLGPGLTPAGDDLLAGLLLGSAFLEGALPPAELAAFVEHVTRRATGGTTAVSAALLGAAAEGTGYPEAVAFVNAVGGHGDPAAALARLCGIGSSSGRDLACGVLAAASVRAAGVPMPTARVDVGS